MQEATVCYPIRDEEVLLIRKRRGVGAGNLVGPGGKLEPGETPADCVRRELREEIDASPRGLDRAGVLDFHFETRVSDERSMHTHVFTATGLDSDPERTPEAVPGWHETDELPYDEMWTDDRIWFPHLLDGRTFVGEFVLADDHRLLAYEIDLDVPVE